MSKPTSLQRKILDAINAGYELTPYGRTYGIYLGEKKIFQTGADPVQVKTKITATTVNTMIANGLIQKITKRHPNGNSQIVFIPLTENPAQHFNAPTTQHAENPATRV